MTEAPKKMPEIIGWREWIGLPLLGLPAIKAKIDTGAKTSSLHAFDIHLETGPKGKTYVHFKIHPLQDDLSVVVSCRSLLIDQRTITDSGGHKEDRYVIRTLIEIGSVKKRIELTLTNRESMKFRMLIGRTGIGQFYIDATQSFLLGKTIKQKKFAKELKLLAHSSD